MPEPALTGVILAYFSLLSGYYITKELINLSKKVAFATLGCKVNQYETEAMSLLFKNKGYTLCDFDEICDIYVINTCTVTNMGDRKSRQMIRKAKKTNPNAIIAAVGCYAQVSSDEIKKIDGVDVVLGTNDRKHIVEYIENLKENEQFENVCEIRKVTDFEDLEIESYDEMERAYIKIEEGCNEFCSYCIIPYARGPVRSRSIDSIINEAKRLVNNGFCEIILTGIHIASYGKDLKDGTLLIDVVENLAKIEGLKRIRLGSIEPRILKEDFIIRLKNTKKVCPHFHISLQSGCDATLKRMNRKYTCDEYLESVSLLRKHFENPNIATDIMVGFPLETDEDFLESVDFMKKVNFSDAHVFAYSNRKGTRADKMEGQIPPNIKDERSKIMSETVAVLKENYMKSFIGKSLNVLFEQRKDKFFEGTSDNYIKVFVQTDLDLTGKIIDVQITDIEDDYLIGTI